MTRLIIELILVAAVVVGISAAWVPVVYVTQLALLIAVCCFVYLRWVMEES